MTDRDPAGRPPERPESPVAGAATHRLPTAAEFREVQASPDFQRLRSSFRAFAFPMTAAFLVWYLSYVLLSTYAEDLMSIDVIGNLNIGLLFGLGQFLSTFLITWLYIRHANRSLDPIASRLRTEMEGDV